MNRKNLKLTAIFILVMASIASAQTESIITPMTSTCNLTESQLAMVSKASDTNYFRQHFFINVNNLSNCQDSGKMLLDLPNVWHEPITLTHNYVEYTNEGEYVYSGVLTANVGDEDSLFYARLLLIGDGGKKYGQLKVNGDIYAIYDLNEECQMMVEMINKEDTSSHNCQRVPLETPAPTHNHFDYNEPNSCGSCVADVYFFYTPAANDADPSLDQTARTSLEIVNVSIANSRVMGVGSQLRLRFNGSEVLNGFVETIGGTNAGANVDADLDNFANNLPIVQTRRNATESDVMVLMTDDVYADVNGRILGLVQQVAYPTFDNGFHLVAFNQAAATHTLPHEIGHLIGLQHQIERQPLTQTVTDDFAHAFQRVKLHQVCCDANGNKVDANKKGLFTNVCTYAVAFKDDGSFNMKKVARLDNYLSPNVSTGICFSGTTTIGNTPEADNARQIGAHGCELANLFPNNVSISSWIEGPKIVCPGQPATYELKKNCAGSISNVTWEYSYTGFAWNNFTGGTIYTHNVNQFVPNEMLFIRATFSINGQSHTTSFRSEIDIFASPCIVQYKRDPAENAEILDKVSIFPNPTKDKVTIRIETENNLEYNEEQLEVYDIFGKKVLAQNIKMPNPGVTDISIDVSSLRKGIYWVKIKDKTYGIEKL